MTDATPPRSTDTVEADLYIADFAEMLRGLLRAIAAVDYSNPLSDSSARLRRLFAYADRLPADLSWYKILEGAVTLLKPEESDRNNYEDDYNRLTLKSVKYLAELTTSDGLSAARISQARRAVEEEIEHVKQRRERRREGFDW